MTKTWLIFTQALKYTVTHLTTLLILGGLIILPSLYTCLTINASRALDHPLKQIQVALVNLDEGTTLYDTPINIGHKFCEALTASSTLNWQLVSPSQSTSGLEKGSYYASLTIPKDFSFSLTQFLQTQESTPSLIYTTAEKTLLRANITSFSNLKATIAQSSLMALNEVLSQNFDMTDFNSLQVHKLIKTLNQLDENRHMYLSLFKDYEEATTQIQTTLATIKQSFPELKTSISNVGAMAQSGEEVLADSTDLVDHISILIENSLNFISVFNTDCISLLDEIDPDLNDSGSFIQVLKLIQQRIFYNESLILALSEQLDQLDYFIPLDDLTYLSHYLTNLHAKFLTLEIKTESLLSELEEKNSFSTHELNAYQAHFEPLSHSVQDALSTYTAEIKPQLQSALKPALNQSTQMMTRSTYLLKELPEVSKRLDSTDSEVKKALILFHEADAVLPQLTNDFHHLMDKFNLLTEDPSIAKVLTTLQAHPHLFADYLATPVHLKEATLFPMPDIGSSLASYYCVIALWLTSLLAPILLPPPREMTPSYSLYFGELSYYVLISLLQTLVLIIGTHLLLGIYDLNFLAYLGTALFCTLSFTIMNYSLITLLGNLGKGLSILLLVFQMSALEGPILSPSFHHLNRCLPFTYAISALKKVQGSLSLRSLPFDFLGLSLFMIFFLWLSLTYYKKSPFL